MRRRGVRRQLQRLLITGDRVAVPPLLAPRDTQVVTLSRVVGTQFDRPCEAGDGFAEFTPGKAGRSQIDMILRMRAVRGNRPDKAVDGDFRFSEIASHDPGKVQRFGMIGRNGQQLPTGRLSLLQSAGAVPQVRALLDRVRDDTATRIIDGIRGERPATPALRAAVHGWLWFMDGVCLDWVVHHDLPRARVHGLLLGTLLGAVTAAGQAGALAG